MWGTAPSMEQLKEVIVGDPSAHPIGKRMRAAYFLKQEYFDSRKKEDEHGNQQEKRDLIIEILLQGLQNVLHGSLMRHEFAYVLGQIGDPQSISILEEILKDSNDCVMVRHEAAEALGAIGSESSRSVLLDRSHADPTNLLVPQELAETCQLALNVMDWRLRKEAKSKDGVNNTDEEEEFEPVGCACMLNPYSSVDPAPPHPSHANMPFSELGEVLRNESKSLFERYRAMFSLRNRGGHEAVEQLSLALVRDKSSALFRHEVAYVLGQLQHPNSIEALSTILRRRSNGAGGEEIGEHMMVRHEAAEALGAIDATSGDQWQKIESILKEFSNDQEQAVAESCFVALDAADYWGHASVEQIDVSQEEKKDPSLRHGDTTSGTSNASSFGHQKIHSTQAPVSLQHFNHAT